jgi:hypothetical protein
VAERESRVSLREPLGYAMEAEMSRRRALTIQR